MLAYVALENQEQARLACKIPYRQIVSKMLKNEEMVEEINRLLTLKRTEAVTQIVAVHLQALNIEALDAELLKIAMCDEKSPFVRDKLTAIELGYKRIGIMHGREDEQTNRKIETERPDGTKQTTYEASWVRRRLSAAGGMDAAETPSS